MSKVNEEEGQFVHWLDRRKEIITCLTIADYWMIERICGKDVVQNVYVGVAVARVKRKMPVGAENILLNHITQVLEVICHAPLQNEFNPLMLQVFILRALTLNEFDTILSRQT